MLSVGFSQNEKLIIGNVEFELGQSFEVAFKKAAIAGYEPKLRESGPITIIDIYEKNERTDKIYKIGTFGLDKNQDVANRKITSLVKYYEKELENGNRKSFVNIMFDALYYFHYNDSKVEIKLTGSPTWKMIQLTSNQDSIYRKVIMTNMVPAGTDPYLADNFVSVSELIMRAN